MLEISYKEQSIKLLETISRIKSADLLPIPNATANFLKTYSSTGDMKKLFRDARGDYQKCDPEMGEKTVRP